VRLEERREGREKSGRRVRRVGEQRGEEDSESRRERERQ
jgi:hypothetical protein